MQERHLLQGRNAQALGIAHQIHAANRFMEDGRQGRPGVAKAQAAAEREDFASFQTSIRYFTAKGLELSLTAIPPICCSNQPRSL